MIGVTHGYPVDGPSKRQARRAGRWMFEGAGREAQSPGYSAYPSKVAWSMDGTT